MSGIFNPNLFNNSAFNVGGGVITPPVVVAVKTGTGGIDPDDRKRKYPPYKPTGLLERRKKNIPQVEARTEEVRDIHSEITQRLAKEFANIEFKPVQEMTSAEIDREIGLLMREKLAKDEEEETMLILMMALNE